MWRKLPYPKPFFLTFTQENGYYIYITDFTNIWWVYYKEDVFLSNLKNINDHLEMENDDELLQRVLKMLLCPESLKKLTLTLEGNALNILMMLAHGPVYMDIKLAEGSKAMLFQKVTKQLLKIIHDLKTSENELRSLLLKKDKEINEYKNETDIRLAKYLKTAVYNDEKHVAKHLEYQKNFGTSDTGDCTLVHVIDETEDLIVVKQEQLKREKVKAEPQEPIKAEGESHSVPETDNQNIVVSTETVKEEIKCEQQNVIPKKKPRKMWQI